MGCHFIMSSPEPKPDRITNDEVKNQSSIELRLTEPLLIANKKLRIYSSLSHIAKPPVVRSWLVAPNETAKRSLKRKVATKKEFYLLNSAIFFAMCSITKSSSFSGLKSKNFMSFVTAAVCPGGI